jgi:hypothetical protein
MPASFIREGSLPWPAMTDMQPFCNYEGLATEAGAREYAEMVKRACEESQEQEIGFDPRTWGCEDVEAFLEGEAEGFTCEIENRKWRDLDYRFVLSPTSGDSPADYEFNGDWQFNAEPSLAVEMPEESVLIDACTRPGGLFVKSWGDTVPLEDLYREYSKEDEGA